MTGYLLNASAAELQFPDDAPTSDASPCIVTPEDAARGGVYALLGALLRGVPDAALIERVRTLPPAVGRDDFALAWEGLRLAAEQLRLNELDDEYHQLFIGLGRGELVPYGSWYQTGFLMEKPLGMLRDDLRSLGFERDPQVREPEDHVAALCEVMSALALDADVSAALGLERQRAFYQTHIADWIGRFWRDLEAAESALFYRSVARLGSSFRALEARYLEPGA